MTLLHLIMCQSALHVYPDLTLNHYVIRLALSPLEVQYSLLLTYLYLLN